MGGWSKNIEIVDFTNEKILQYHIDTRDFMVTTSQKPCKEEKITKLFLRKPDKFYSPDEIRNRLLQLKEQSGGHKDWRCLNLNGSWRVQNWRIKYIRIYRLKEGLIVCNQDSQYLTKSDFYAPIKVDDYA